MINYLPFMQIQKESRSYIVLLPFNAPFEEVSAVMLEFSQKVLEEQKMRKEQAEKESLQKEMANQKSEAKAG